MPGDDKRSAKGGSKLAFVLPVVIVAAIGIWFWVNRGSEAAVQPGGEHRVQSTLHLETFVLNLADSDQKAYLRVGVDLGLNQDIKHGEEVPVARVRDAILAVLAQAKGAELVTAPGKAKLKQDLLQALQERVPQLGVEEVYFTEFLIQR